MLSTEQRAYLARCELAKKHPWHFLHIIKTWDEHDRLAGAKPFPCKAVDRIVCRAWMDYDLLFMEKARQLRMTWRISALCLHDVMHFKGRRYFFRSQKQEFADAVLDRARGIYDELQNDGYPYLPRVKTTGDKSGTKSKLEFPDMHSVIQAVPQGSEVVVSYTASGIFDDEIALQDQAQRGFEQAYPTIKGGGKYCAVGTPNGKVFNYMKMYAIDENTGRPRGRHEIDSTKVKDELFTPPSYRDKEHIRRWKEEQLLALSDDEFAAVPFEVLCAFAPGIKYWRTCDGVDVLSVHYSSDPDCSPDTEIGRKWIENERRGISESGWQQQYEISYDTFEGRPVIMNFSRNRQVFVRGFDLEPKTPIRLSIDFGTRVSCCLMAQLVQVEGFTSMQLRFFEEIFLEFTQTHELAQTIVEMMKLRYRGYWMRRGERVKVYCDPAGYQSRETTADANANTSIQILRNYGIPTPTAKKFGVPDSTRLAEATFALMYPNGEPAILVHERCERLIKALESGWRFPLNQKPGGKVGYPEKDNYYEHIGDCVRYMIGNTFRNLNAVEKQTKPVRVPVYEKWTGRRIGSRMIYPRGAKHNVLSV